LSAPDTTAGEPPLSGWGVAALVLLGLAFGLSLFFNGLHIPLLGASGVLLVVVLALALAPGIRSGWQVPRSPAAAWLVVWWVFLALSLAWSTVVFTSSLYYWWLSALPLTFFALVLAPAPRAWTRAALTGLMAAALLLSLWALVQFFVFPETYGYRAHHPLLNPNNLAGLLSLALLPLVARYLGAEMPGRVGLLWASSLMVFAGVVSTQSRGALIGLGVALAVLVVLGRGVAGVNRKRLGALAAAALAIFLVMDWWAGAALSQRVETLGAVGAESSFQTRLLIWESTLQMVAERPWLGYGLGTFFLYYPRFRQPGDSSGGFYAHMDPLQFWAELGVLGPALFYLVLIAILVQTVRVLRRLAAADPRRLELLGLFGGLLAVAVHTHITFHLYILPILIGAGAVLAAWQVACEGTLERSRARIALPRGAHPRVWGGILAGMVALVVLNLGSAGAAAAFIQWGREAVDEGEIARALDSFHYARALAPASDTPLALGAEIRAAALSRSGPTLADDERQALYREAQALLDRAQRRNPARATHDFTRARLALLAPDQPEAARLAAAERNFRRALAKDPRLIKARMGLANLLQARGDQAQALHVLEAGLKWPYPGPRPVALFMRVATMRAALGDPEGAVAMARSALRRLPADQTATRQAIRERFGLAEAGKGRDPDGQGAAHGAP